VFITLDGSTPTLTNYDYWLDHYLSDFHLTISHADEAVRSNCISSSDGSPKPCKMKVGVFGVIAAAYSISLASNLSATTLPLGRSQRSQVGANMDNVYRVQLSRDLSQRSIPYTLRFSISVSSGAAALYISCITPTPSSATAQWAASPIDALHGSIVDVESVTAGEKGCHRHCSAGDSIEFYASVHGTSRAVYTISASIVNDTALQLLVPGHEVVGSVAQNSFVYYYLPLAVTDPANPSSAVSAAENDLFIALNVLQGYADAFFSLTWSSRPIYNASTHSASSYLFSTSAGSSANSFSMLMTKEVEVGHDKAQDLCSSGESTCYLVVGVLGERVQTSRYSLQVTYKDATKLLSDGVSRLSSPLLPFDDGYY
jgi:hypothetical protein